MSPREQLFALEVEFHRRLRTGAPGTGDVSAIHTSYALQSGYEPLLKWVGSVTEAEVEAVQERLLKAGDARDVLSARGKAGQRKGKESLRAKKARHLIHTPRAPSREREARWAARSCALRRPCESHWRSWRAER